MAYDQRFAIAYVSSSGEGGAKMHRRNWGELVENVAATSEYHWMAGNFLKYAGPLNWNDCRWIRMSWWRCALRGRCSSAAARPTAMDGWTPKACSWPARTPGRSTSCSARKIWAPMEFPPIETALIDGDVAFRQHSGGHTDAAELADVPDLRRPVYQGSGVVGVGEVVRPTAALATKFVSRVFSKKERRAWQRSIGLTVPWWR